MSTPLVYPDLMPIPFANAGSKNTIPEASASPLASLTDGFPAVTMQPISSGGVPPAGMDMNGILFWITQFQTWVNGGGRFKFNSVLAASIGGYPVGIILMLDDNVSEVLCVTANNTNDPNSNMTGWAPYAGALGGAGRYVLDTGAANAYVALVSPPILSYKNGYRVAFKSIHNNTGASTLNAGGGAVALKRSDGAALVAGDIITGSVYEAVYDSATGFFWLTDIVPSQVQAEVFASPHIVTGSRATGTTYTNNTGRAMFVNVSIVNGGAASNLDLLVNGSIVTTQGQAAPGAVYAVAGVVPPGATYRANISSGGTVNIWTETY